MNSWLLQLCNRIEIWFQMWTNVDHILQIAETEIESAKQTAQQNKIENSPGSFSSCYNNALRHVASKTSQFKQSFAKNDATNFFLSVLVMYVA